MDNVGRLTDTLDNPFHQALTEGFYLVSPIS